MGVAGGREHVDGSGGGCGSSGGATAARGQRRGRRRHRRTGVPGPGGGAAAAVATLSPWLDPLNVKSSRLIVVKCYVVQGLLLIVVML